MSAPQIDAHVIARVIAPSASRYALLAVVLEVEDWIAGEASYVTPERRELFRKTAERMHHDACAEAKRGGAA